MYPPLPSYWRRRPPEAIGKSENRANQQHEEETVFGLHISFLLSPQKIDSILCASRNLFYSIFASVLTNE